MGDKTRILTLTAIAMIAFAANSILVRLALVGDHSGPWEFALIRLISGAAVLMALARGHIAGDWRGAASLLAYMAGFSFAYLELGAGPGALILFGFVQLTMIGWGLTSGERLNALQWLGVIAAIAGLVGLVGFGSVDGMAAIYVASMAAAGIAWGLYSLHGRQSSNPLRDTAGNFIRATAIAIVLFPAMSVFGTAHLPDTMGVLAAIASGALASGLGYAVWYTVVRSLSATEAGVAQLSVPVLTAAAGIAFLAEPITIRFLVCSTVILLGVAAVMIRR